MSPREPNRDESWDEKLAQLASLDRTELRRGTRDNDDAQRKRTKKERFAMPLDAQVTLPNPASASPALSLTLARATPFQGDHEQVLRHPSPNKQQCTVRWSQGPPDCRNGASPMAFSDELTRSTPSWTSDAGLCSALSASGKSVSPTSCCGLKFGPKNAKRSKT